MTPSTRARGDSAAASRARRMVFATLAPLTLSFLCACASLPPGAADPSQAVAAGHRQPDPEATPANGRPAGPAEEARRNAAAALTKGDVEGALQLYVEAVKLDPEDSESLYAIGALHERRGNKTLAIRAYAEAVAVDPVHALALERLGLAQLEARDSASAEETLRRALDVQPDLWRAHDALGIIEDMDGRHEAATVHYTEAMRLQPTIASIVNNRGYSRYLAGDLEAARNDFRRAIEIDPKYERAWKNLGLVHARLHEYDPALRALSQVMPRHVAANDVGYVAMRDGNYETANALFEEAIMTSPRYYPTAQQNVAELRRLRSQEQGPGALALGR